MCINSSLKALLHFSGLSRSYYKWRIAGQRAEVNPTLQPILKLSIPCNHFMDIAAWRWPYAAKALP